MATESTRWADMAIDDEASGAKDPQEFSKVETQRQKFYTKSGKAMVRVTKVRKVRSLVPICQRALDREKSWTPFGSMADEGKLEQFRGNPSVEEIEIIRTKRVGGVHFTATAAADNQEADTAQTEEDKFHEECVDRLMGLGKFAKPTSGLARPAANKFKAMADEANFKRTGVDRTLQEDSEEEPATAPAPGKYVPPSLRGKGLGTQSSLPEPEVDRNVDPTVRISNLSESATEMDVHDLVTRFGRVSKMFLAKDRDTGRSKGFAFVTFAHRESAEQCVERLNGHGFDHLLLRVSWADPPTSSGGGKGFKGGKGGGKGKGGKGFGSKGSRPF